MRFGHLLSGASVALLCFGGAAHASDAVAPTMYSLTEENDGIFTGQDRHYTQGLMFTRTATPLAGGFWDGLAQRFGDVAGFLGAGRAVSRRYQFPILGQSEFTPTDIMASQPDPRDRPYAGWLYTGASLSQQSASGRTDRLQLLLGVVGPYALAKQVQDGFHSFAGYGQANGYSHQIGNEPGLLLGYQTTWRVPLLDVAGVASELRPETGVTLGNVLTYGEVGVSLRLGQSLAAGGTPQTITPGLSGSADFDPRRLDGAFGWMVYGGIQTRAVWRNIFLEGNSFTTSAHVAKRNFVTDEDLGVALMFRFGLRLDISYIKRSREFSGQVNDDRFGSITLTAPF